MCICIQVSVCVRARGCMRGCVHVCVHVCVCMCMCVHMYVNVHVCLRDRPLERERFGCILLKSHYKPCKMNIYSIQVDVPYK